MKVKREKAYIRRNGVDCGPVRTTGWPRELLLPSLEVLEALSHPDVAEHQQELFPPDDSRAARVERMTQRGTA